MKEFCSLISNLFLFFSWHFRVVPHFRSKFSKTKGGTLWWKKSEKNRFLCLIPQKNRLEKCRLAVKSVFKNIDFWGSYGPKSTKMDILALSALSKNYFDFVFQTRRERLQFTALNVEKKTLQCLAEMAIVC